jgi:hypothetical protein
MGGEKLDRYIGCERFGRKMLRSKRENANLTLSSKNDAWTIIFSCNNTFELYNMYISIGKI